VAALVGIAPTVDACVVDRFTNTAGFCANADDAATTPTDAHTRARLNGRQRKTKRGFIKSKQGWKESGGFPAGLRGSRTVAVA